MNRAGWYFPCYSTVTCHYKPTVFP